MKAAHPVVLVILDGVGYSAKTAYNAVAQAHTPHLDAWLKQCSHALLQAAGAYVGLPPGYIGNSEVGHVAIGAGRVIPQPVTRINEFIANNQLCANNQLSHVLTQLSSTPHALHIMGLLSDAGVHALQSHIHAYIACAAQHALKKIYVHAFLDGRDTPPQSATVYLEQLEPILQRYNAQLASLHGRFYAMDRDKHWERTEKTYRVLTDQHAPVQSHWRTVLEHAYARGITDEFVEPVRLIEDAYVRDGDVVLHANYRPDRARQLTECFVQSAQVPFKKHAYTPLTVVTPVAYSAALAGKTVVLFNTPKIGNTLKEVLQNHNKTMVSVAETEKYAHVTYFFNGQKEDALKNETRVLVPSRPLRDYRAYPRMSAAEITDAVINSLHDDPKDFYLINYANADMVGHSGDMAATVEAVSFLDIQLGRLYDAVVHNMNGTLYITADHGNAEDMYDAVAQQPRTAHTTNPVPFIKVTRACDADSAIAGMTQLADIAPVILATMGIPVPPDMR